jgi:hypothetical protein
VLLGVARRGSSPGSSYHPREASVRDLLTIMSMLPLGCVLLPRRDIYSNALSRGALYIQPLCRRWGGCLRSWWWPALSAVRVEEAATAAERLAERTACESTACEESSAVVGR